MNIPFSPPFIGEEEINEVIDTLRSGWITTGPKTKKFEKMLSEYCNTDCTVCLNSATAALELTLRLLGIGEGDEVISTAYTYTATVSVCYHLGATVRLVDCNAEDFLIDCDKIIPLINEHTKAIIAVDIAGVPCNYSKLSEIVENTRGIFNPSSDLQKAIGRVVLISDGAHSLGAIYKGKRACTYADFTTFSFHAVKNLTTAEGGAVTFSHFDGVDTNELYRQYQLMSLHGQSKDALSKSKKGDWEYDVVAPLFKCNMTDIMASIGFRQLEKYDGFLARRKQIVEKYEYAFKDLPVILPKMSDEDFSSSYHLYLVLLTENDVEYRNKIIEYMASKDIACNVHYKPLPLLSAYKQLGFDINDYPVAYNKYVNEISLPIFNNMTDDQVDYVIENFKMALEEV